MKNLLTVAFVVTLIAATSMNGQVRLMRSILVTNTTNNTTQLIEASPSSSQRQSFSFPNTIGVATNVINVLASTSGTVTTEWAAPGGSVSSLAKVINTEVLDGPATTTATTITVSASSRYRFDGQFTMRREGANDTYTFGVGGGGAGGGNKLNFLELSIECDSCTAGTTIGGAAPPYYSTSGATVSDSPIVNPSGATLFNGYIRLRVRGVLETLAGVTEVLVVFNKSTGSSATYIVEGNWLVTPL